ncbi:MAG: hypothetical protein Crog4KO_18400 [Crocinitomicaceae bacterium]
MKRLGFYLSAIAFIVGGLTLNTACSDSFVDTSDGNPMNVASRNREASAEAKKYWYDGTAEITSYKLSQARYGEMREGKAVMVFVTEPFSRESFTKADGNNESNVPVLKLNATKKFTTGIYPYSLMTSSFFPFEGDNESIKIAFTMQEWCGTMFSEMRNQKGELSFSLDSYFEGESFENQQVKSAFLEDDIWSLIRLNPDGLPAGEITMVPSMAYLRMSHKPLKAYKTMAESRENKNGTMVLTLSYPELNRTLSIEYESDFPHAILGWEETYIDGGRELTSKAERIKQIKSAYWNKNSNSDTNLREELGLD